jgi:hypothetical protein
VCELRPPERDRGITQPPENSFRAESTARYGTATTTDIRERARCSYSTGPALKRSDVARGDTTWRLQRGSVSHYRPCPCNRSPQEDLGPRGRPDWRRGDTSHSLGRVLRHAPRGSHTTMRFTRTRLSVIVHPVSSLQLTKDLDRVRSFGGLQQASSRL